MPATAWQAFRHGAILISEPLSWRLGLSPGQSLVLTTATGAREFRIAGVYREYGNDRGEILMDLDDYRRHWHDREIGGLGIYLDAGVTAAARCRRCARPPAAARRCSSAPTPTSVRCR